MTHLIVSGCKVEVLLVRDMFDKNGKKDSKPKGVARPCGALKLKPFICQRVKEQCSLSSLSMSHVGNDREVRFEGGIHEVSVLSPRGNEVSLTLIPAHCCSLTSLCKSFLSNKYRYEIITTRSSGPFQKFSTMVLDR